MTEEERKEQLKKDQEPNNDEEYFELYGVHMYE